MSQVISQGESRSTEKPAKYHLGNLRSWLVTVIYRYGEMQMLNYFLRWRMRARIRRFLRPIFRRPLPVFLTPTKAPFSPEMFVR